MRLHSSQATKQCPHNVGWLIPYWEGFRAEVPRLAFTLSECGGKLKKKYWWLDLIIRESHFTDLDHNFKRKKSCVCFSSSSWVKGSQQFSVCLCNFSIKLELLQDEKHSQRTLSLGAGDVAQLVDLLAWGHRELHELGVVVPTTKPTTLEVEASVLELQHTLIGTEQA